MTARKGSIPQISAAMTCGEHLRLNAVYPLLVQTMSFCDASSRPIPFRLPQNAGGIFLDFIPETPKLITTARRSYKRAADICPCSFIDSRPTDRAASRTQTEPSFSITLDAVVDGCCDLCIQSSDAAVTTELSLRIMRFLILSSSFMALAR